MFSPQTGQFALFDIRLGSRGDSYYEYLLKQWIQTASPLGLSAWKRFPWLIRLRDCDRTVRNPYIARWALSIFGSIGKDFAEMFPRYRVDVRSIYERHRAGLDEPVGQAGARVYARTRTSERA